MTVTIELTLDIEASLTTLAAAQGIGVSQYVRQLLEEQVPGHVKPELSPAQRIALWEDIQGLPVTPLLSDAAISRESMYGPRG